MTRRRYTDAAVVVFLALLCGGSAACRQDPVATAAGFVASGDRYAKDGRFKEAILEYRNALTHQPDVAETHAKLADAYEKSGDAEKALSSLVAVTRLDERNVHANLTVARALLASRRPEDARQLADRVLRTDPKHVEALTIVAETLAAGGFAKAAEEKLQEALAADPHSLVAQLTQANWHVRNRKIVEGLKTLRKVVDDHPNSPAAWVALGTLQWQTRAAADAERSLQKALELTTNKAPVHRTLAAFYLQTTRAAQAEEHLRAAAETSPRDRLQLADFYIASGKLDEGDREVEAVLKHKPVAGAAHLRRARIREAQGRRKDAFAELALAKTDRAVEDEARLLEARLLAADSRLDEALQQARQVAEAQPRRADANVMAARIEMARGNFGEAEEWFNRATTSVPADAAAQMSGGFFTSTGMLKDERGDADGARAAYERALKLDPNNGVAANNLAWIYAGSGRLAEAAVLAERARRLLNGAPEALDTLGWTYHLAGRKKDAIRVLRQAVEARPDNATYRNHLEAAINGTAGAPGTRR